MTITKLVELKKPTRIKRHEWQTLQKIYAQVCNWALSELLSGIRWERKSTKQADRNLNNWTFYQLKEFISYKARMAGIPVLEVSPKYTSQKCYACGMVRKSNRQGRSYRCACGYKAHADLNGARNIALAELVELTHAKRSRKVAV